MAVPVILLLEFVNVELVLLVTIVPAKHVRKLVMLLDLFQPLLVIVMERVSARLFISIMIVLVKTVQLLVLMEEIVIHRPVHVHVCLHSLVLIVRPKTAFLLVQQQVQ